MTEQNPEKVREKILTLISSEFESDSQFERKLNLPPKTVSNWRRGKSSSYMKMLPTLADEFKITVGELLDVPLENSTELSEDELALLKLYRKSRAMPPKLRTAMQETIESVINLYTKTAFETKTQKSHTKREKKNTKTE